MLSYGDRERLCYPPPLDLLYTPYDPVLVDPFIHYSMSSFNRLVLEYVARLFVFPLCCSFPLLPYSCTPLLGYSPYSLLLYSL